MMNKIFKDIGILLLEILFMIIGIPIFLLVAFLGFFYTLFKHLLITRDYAVKRQLYPILRNINLCFDGFANAVGGEMLNDALDIKNNIVRYGKWYETISAITGLINIIEKDTWLRRLLDKVLGKEHCETAITKMQKFYYITIKNKNYESTKSI